MSLLHSVSCLTSSGYSFLAVQPGFKNIPVSQHLAQWTHYAHAGQHSPSCRMGVAHATWGHFSVVHVTCFSCTMKWNETLKIMETTVIWDVTPFSLVDRYQRFDPRGGGSGFPWDVGTFLSDYMVSHPEDSHLYIHKCKNLQSHTKITLGSEAVYSKR